MYIVQYTDFHVIVRDCQLIAQMYSIAHTSPPAGAGAGKVYTDL